VPVFVLPIGPVEALVSFELFVRPALRRMLGAATTERAQVRVTMAGSFASPRGRRQYALVQVRHDPGRGYVAVPLAGGAPTLTAFAAANALLVVPEATTRVETGTVFAALLLERRGG
jgi:molybdopterin molybdotransferase